jgi:hypothetical protein
MEKGNELRISESLALPLDIVTDTIGILAVKGSGKTYAFLTLVEEMVRRNLPAVVIDTMGVCWGLRSSVDGKSPGLPIVILGGTHGDVPLESTAGKVIADWIVGERQPAVLDISEFTKGESSRFILDFLTRLFQANRSALHLFIDEADEWAPQRPFREEARTLRAMEVLVRRGRARGIGVTLVTQRPATLNKNVLTQVGALIVGRMISPQDRKAVQAWIDAHGTEHQKEAFWDSLASLSTKEKWIWAPARNIFKRVTIRLRETFDSSATPRVGEKVSAPRSLAEVDLEKLKGRIADTIERAKQEDPRELRKKILELEKELQKKPTYVPFVPPIQPVIKEIPVLKDAQIAALDRTIKKLEEIRNRFAEPIDQMAKCGLAISDAIKKFQNPLPVKHSVQFDKKADLPRPTIPKDNIPISNLSNPEQRILNSIAWMESIGIIEPKQTAIAFLAGYSYGGGAFNNPRGALRTKGLIEYRGDSIALTDHGRPLATPLPYPLTVEEMHGRVLKILPGPERKLMEVVLSMYPNSITNEELADRAGYVVGGGAFNNPRGRLRTLGLIEYNNGLIKAKPFLFLE